MKEGTDLRPPAPYVGLRPFEFHESSLFYGRGEHIAEMVRTLRKSHFLAVIGSSGSGKSSLVRAGLLPAIDAGFMDDGEDASEWRFVILRPGLDPYENLLSALLPGLAPGQALAPDLVEFRRQTLRGGPRGLVEAVADSLLPEPVRLVVLVDQFEEIFRFLDRGIPGASREQSSDAERRNAALAFVDLLLATAAQRDPHVYVILTMRSEYLGECEAFLGLSAAIARAQFLTPRMTREQIQDVIERALAAFGASIDPPVVTELLNALGTNQDQLPRVEHVLLRMWNQVREKARPSGAAPGQRICFTLEDYRTTGGFEKALDEHAEELYRDLGTKPETHPLPPEKPAGDATSPPADQPAAAATEPPPSEKQRVAERLFRSLAVRSPQGTLVRRFATLGEVAAIAGASEQIVAEVVEHFRQPGCNFLVATPADPLTGDTTLDISHESLLRQWDRMRRWVTAEAGAAAELLRLVRDAESWREGTRGFLRQPELGLFTRWRQQVPSPAWATRYVQPEQFSLADDYLAASRQEEVRLQEEAEKDRKEELRRERQRATDAETAAQRQRKLFWVACIATIVAGAIGSYGFRQKARAEFATKEAIIQKDNAQSLQQQAQTAATLANTQSKLAEKAKEAATAATKEAKAAKDEASKRLSEVSWQVAQQARGFPFAPRQLSDSTATWQLLQAAQVAQDTGQESARFNALLAARAATGNLQATFLHGGPVTGATFSSDGRRILSWSDDGTARLWDAASGQPIGQPMAHEPGSWMKTGQFSPDDRYILTWASDRVARLWNAVDAQPIPQVTIKDVMGGQFSPDGRRILGWSTDGTARLWDVADGKSIGQTMAHEKGKTVMGAQFSADGQRILTWAIDDTARLWDADGRPIGQPLRPEKGTGTTGAQFSPDGTRVIAWGGRYARCWSAADGKPLGKPLIHDELNLVAGAQFSPDFQQILTWDSMCWVNLWDAATGKLLSKFADHKRNVNGAQFSPGGERILSWSEDGTARWWRPNDQEPIGKTTGQPMQHDRGKSVEGVQFSPDGEYLVTWSDDGTARVWNATDGTAIGQPLRHEYGKFVQGAQFSPDGRHLLSWCRDNTVRLWNLIDYRRIDQPAGQVIGAVVATPLGETTAQAAVAPTNTQFSPDGRLILRWNFDGTVGLTAVADGRLVGQLVSDKKERGVAGAQTSADSQRILTWSDEGVARLWDAANGQSIGQPMPHGKGLTGVQFSPDRRRIFSVGLGGARFWDAETGQAIGQPLPHGKADGYLGGRFSGDGARLITWSDDGTLRLWNTADGQPIGQPIQPGTANRVNGAQLSPDGHRILGWSNDAAHLWDVADGRPIGQPMAVDASSVANGARFTADGRHILTWTNHGVISLWDAADGRPVGRAMRHDDGTDIHGVRLSADGWRILSYGSDGTVRVWDAESGQAITSPMRHEQPPEMAVPDVGSPEAIEPDVLGAEFSDDGQRILSWSDDGTARLWSATSGDLIAAYHHKWGITAAKYIAREQRILTAGTDEAIRVWDIALDPALSLEDYAAEFSARSATKLGDDGKVQLLSETEFAEKRRLWQETLQKRKAQP